MRLPPPQPSRWLTINISRHAKIEAHDLLLVRHRFYRFRFADILSEHIDAHLMVSVLFGPSRLAQTLMAAVGSNHTRRCHESVGR